MKQTRWNYKAEILRHLAQAWENGMTENCLLEAIRGKYPMARLDRVENAVRRLVETDQIICQTDLYFPKAPPKQERFPGDEFIKKITFNEAFAGFPLRTDMKMGMDEAEKEWNKLENDGVDMSEVARGIKNYAQTVPSDPSNPEARFNLSAQWFMKKRRWLDYLTASDIDETGDEQMDRTLNNMTSTASGGRNRPDLAKLLRDCASKAEVKGETATIFFVPGAESATRMALMAETTELRILATIAVGRTITRIKFE